MSLQPSTSVLPAIEIDGIARSSLAAALAAAPGDTPLAISTDDGEQVIIDVDGGVRIEDRFGNRVRLDSKGVTIESAGRVAVAAGTISITAGLMTLDAGMVQVSAVRQCDTLIANAVVSSSYAPGAGNVWGAAHRR